MRNFCYLKQGFLKTAPECSAQLTHTSSLSNYEIANSGWVLLNSSLHVLRQELYTLRGGPLEGGKLGQKPKKIEHNIKEKNTNNAQQQ